MPTWFQRQPLIVSLAALAAVLVIVIGLELGFGTGLRSALSTSSPRKAAPAEAKLLPPVVATAPEQAYPETAARPLFTPTRRPAPEAAAVAQTTFKRDQFVLQGVTIVGDNRIALLREKANGRVHRVERGKEVNGIKVVEIQPEVVTLALGGEQEVLALTVQKAAVAPAGAMPQGPFGPGVPGTAATLPTPASSSPPPPPPQAGNMPANPLAGRTEGTPQPAPGQAAPSQPATATAPLTPEELLARRRARRSQPNQ